jgi:hypothetical protein
MQRKIKLNETKTFTQNGILKFINDNINLEWFSNIYSQDLEKEYYYGHSGEKNISVLFYNLLVQTNTDLTTDIINTPQSIYTTLANIIINRFRNNWNKIYLSYVGSEYNPIHNYNMEETEKINTKITTNNNNIEKINSKLVIENNSSENTTLDTDIENNVKNQIYGFNSVNGVNSDNQNSKGSQNSNSNTTNNNTQTQTRDVNTNYNEENREEIIERNSDNNYIHKERSGNIGVTTTQKMLMEELELRKYDLITRIFDDIDKIITNPLYY